MSWGGAPYSYPGNGSSGDISTSWGLNNRANGILSTAFGWSNNALSRHETVMGSYSTDYVPVPEMDTDRLYCNEAYNNNRIFNVGIGTADSSSNSIVRKDAFTILKNGKVGVGISNFEITGSNAKFQVNGSIRITGDDNKLSKNVCDSNNLGKIIFVEDNFYGCKST